MKVCSAAMAAPRPHVNGKRKNVLKASSLSSAKRQTLELVLLLNSAILVATGCIPSAPLHVCGPNVAL